MKRKWMRFIGYTLTVILLAALTMAMATCSSTSASTTSTTTSTLALTSISVTIGSSADITVGSTRQFTATGTYSDGSTRDITSQVSWTSSNPTIATISSPSAAFGYFGGGVVTCLTAGSTDITASLHGITSPPVPLTVIAPTTSP